MVKNNVRWHESQIKSFYEGYEETSALMAYLDKKIFEEEMAAISSENAYVNEENGDMIYKYNARNVLLTAAPRKREPYIHVVLIFGGISDVELLEQGFKIGNGKGKSQDVKLYSITEIDRLLELVKKTGTQRLSSATNEKRENGESLPVTLEEWLDKYIADSEYQERNKKLDTTREQFLEDFDEIRLLREGNISLQEFKKKLDVKSRQKVDGMNLWGFNGFSGQMFFNQLYNQAEYTNQVDRLKDSFLKTILLPDSFEILEENVLAERLNSFTSEAKEMRQTAIERGLSPQKCANVNFIVFFISFFWGLQRIHQYPIYYKASREGLDLLGYEIEQDGLETSGDKYLGFLSSQRALSQEIEAINGESYDMADLSHFLYFVQEQTNESSAEVIQEEEDPIQDEPFAHVIADLLLQSGYTVMAMSEIDYEAPAFSHWKKAVSWRFELRRKSVSLALIIMWRKPEDLHAALFEEDEDAEQRFLGEIDGDNEQSFLEKLVPYLHRESERQYTLQDAVKETYLDSSVLKEWLDLLGDRKQIVLYGPPGTGKTFVAQRLGKILSQSDRRTELVQFHPSYTYEEFIEGLRPEVVQSESGASLLQVNVKPGLFARLCAEARKKENREKNYVLIIDEFNRANTAKVFGELLYALEYRNEAIPLPYSKEKLIVPDNLYIIGTMNTTDRSLAQIDIALRRRFQFIPFTSKETKQVLRRFVNLYAPEMNDLPKLIEEVNRSLGSKEHALGHSYFMKPGINLQSLRLIWKYQIIPYLEEYFVMEPDRVDQYDLDLLIEQGGYFHE